MEGKTVAYRFLGSFLKYSIFLFFALNAWMKWASFEVEQADGDEYGDEVAIATMRVTVMLNWLFLSSYSFRIYYFLFSLKTSLKIIQILFFLYFLINISQQCDDN